MKKPLSIILVTLLIIIFNRHAVSAFQNQSSLLQREWGLFAVEAPEVWSMGITGEGVIVAVIDTGIDTDLSDLNGNILPGYNVITKSASIDDIEDNNGHGTRVSTLIAGNGQGLGLLGVAPEAKILPVKVIDNFSDGKAENIQRGIIWAVDNGAKIINMSIGSSKFNSSINEAVKYAQMKGCIVVAAAGNHITENRSNILFPGSLPGVVTVGAITKEYEIATFSNKGNSMDVLGPGTEILTYDILKEKLTEDYGTSMSTPFVSGVAALIWSAYPDWSSQQVISALQSSAKPLDCAGRSPEYGFGLPSALKAIKIGDSKTFLAPANVDYSGAILKESLSDTILTISPLTWHSNNVINLEKIDAPAPLESNIIPASDTIKVSWDSTEKPHKILKLTVPIFGNLNLTNYLFRWDGSSWIRVGGGKQGGVLSVGIYEQGIYRVGQMTLPVHLDLSGEDPIETAINVAGIAFPTGASSIILVSSDNYLNSLAAVPLAYKINAPILFINADFLDIRVKEEMKLLAPKSIYLIGGTEDITTKVELELAEITNVHRIAGSNQYDTAAQIAKTLGTTGKAIIASGENFPDALSVAAIAAQEGIPILLTNNSGSLPIETLDALNSLRVTDTVVIGGNKVVSDDIFEQLPGPIRLGGLNRYSTNHVVNDTFPLDREFLVCVSVEDFHDALIGNVLASVNSSNVYFRSKTPLYLDNL